VPRANLRLSAGAGDYVKLTEGLEREISLAPRDLGIGFTPDDVQQIIDAGRLFEIVSEFCSPA